MTNFVSHIRDAMAKRAQYARTLAELEKLPEATAQDIGISSSDAARQVAHRSVYGY